MYISSLDRPWLETPFLLQGFAIETEEDLLTIAEYCDYVYVDLAQSKIKPGERLGITKVRKGKSTAEILSGRPLSDYVDKTSWKDEFPKAKVALNNLSDCVRDIIAGSEKSISLDIVKVKRAVEPMIDSISRNPDACIWLARMKSEDDYAYQHSLGCAIWAVALGRQLGLPKSDLRSLAIGGLLFDVGKLQVDRALLSSNRRLSDCEFQRIKQHVEIGLESLKDSGVLNQDILDIVAFHHERHNGKGYPNGLAGDDIPVFARIAAIVDCYDAITSQRPYAKALSPSIAIKKLYEWKDIDFQSELVEEFIQAIGIYPAGTLVEISSGEIAIVVAEYRSRRLRPQLMLLLDANKMPLAETKIIDLMVQTHTADGKPLDIVNSLEAEAYGIDMVGISL